MAPEAIRKLLKLTKDQYDYPCGECNSCCQAKASTLPMPKHGISSGHSVIRVDQYGPLPPDMDGNKYGTMFLHCPSRTSALILGQNISHSEKYLKQFLDDRPLQMSAQVLHSDSSSILMTEEWRELCRAYLMQPRENAPATPQQNAVVEQRIANVMRMARAFFAEAHLNWTFWGVAAIAANYVINRIPTKSLNWRTPYELLYAEEADASLLITFGC
jgi:hypothetical protein